MLESKYSFPKGKIEIVLAEKIDPQAQQTFEEAGYKVKLVPDALEGDLLKEILATAHIIGVRSRSKVTEDALKVAKRLIGIGCFTVGTDQVDLSAARSVGSPVFNAPHSSTRSVAELTLACVISLARRMGDQNFQIKTGHWEKSAKGAVEVRNKSIGLVGYGHIGQQVGLLCEALGLNVYFYDILKKLPLGRASAVSSMDELIAKCNFISLHIPSSNSTNNLFNASLIKKMKKGSFLINHSRGSVVDLEALREALMSGHLAGAAIDVFPSEPHSNSSPFVTPLAECPNMILTPHIGGSTEEAQCNIGREVANSLISYLDNGSTIGAVNFPNVNLPSLEGSHRILNIHKNIPGALSEVNQVISEVGANIDAQYLSTSSDIGYLIMDINKEVSEEVREKISFLPKSIKTRILF